MLQVCDIVYYGLDSFDRDRQRWRVDAHMKRVEDTFGQKPIETVEDQILYDIISMEILKQKLRREEQGLPHTRRFRYQWCRPEEATHVCLSGICGAIAPIEKCEFIKVVEWPQEQIEEARKSAVSDFWLKGDHRPYGWFWE